MPSFAETLILLYVLAAVFVSLPVALLFRPRAAPAPGMPPPLPAPPPLWPDLPYAPPGVEIRLPLQPAAQDWSRSDGWFALFLALVVAVLLGPVSSLLMHAAVTEGGDKKVEYTSSLFVTQIIFQAGVIGLVLTWLRAVRKYDTVRLFGLRERGPVITPLLALLWLVIAWISVAVISTAVLPLMEMMTGLDLKEQSLVESAPDIDNTTTRVLMVITLCVGAPLMEELIFRGVLYKVAMRFTHPVYATVSTSLLFGVIHNNLLSLVPLTVLGIFLAEAYRRTRTLVVPVLMHSMFNGISYLVLTYGPPELRQ